jgi:hypothetical protein
MKSPAKSLFFATTAVALAAALSGCVVAPAPYYQQPAYGPAGGAVYGDVVTMAPPAPYVETIGVAPAVGYVWFGGYWNWAGGRHVWVPGYWGPGRPGHAWVPHQWVREGGGWRLNAGHWQRH